VKLDEVVVGRRDGLGNRQKGVLPIAFRLFFRGGGLEHATQNNQHIERSTDQKSTLQ
jgi:hypothetical protein